MARACRTPHGLLLLNFIGATEGPTARATAAVMATLAAASAGPVALLAPNRTLLERAPSFASTLFAVAGPLPATPTPHPLPVPSRMQPYVETVLRARVDGPVGGTVLTDAYSPLDAWTTAAITLMRY